MGGGKNGGLSSQAGRDGAKTERMQRKRAASWLDGESPPEVQPVWHAGISPTITGEQVSNMPSSFMADGGLAGQMADRYGRIGHRNAVCRT